MKIKSLFDNGQLIGYRFYCPGCKEYHWFDLSRWSFNGDTERPTFTSSLITDPNGKKHCHLFVTDGKIQYLSDCHHELAGQTVEMWDL